MKRILLSGLLLAAVTVAKAQNAEVKYIKRDSQMSPSDTSSYVNTGVVAEKIKHTDSQEAAFTKLTDMNYNKEPDIYKALYDIKKNKGDKEGAKAILEKGRKIFP